MAYETSAQGPYSNNGNFLLFVYVRRNNTDVANRRASYAYAVEARNPNGLSSSYYLDNIGGVMNFDPGNPAADRPFAHNLDFRGGQASIVLASGDSGWFQHDSNGYLTVNFAAAHGPSDTFGTGYASGRLIADRIPVPPSAPGAPTFSNVTSSNIRVTVSPPGDNGGSSVTEYDFQISTNSDMSGATTRNHNGNILDFPGLNRYSMYYFRVRARNGVNWGPWSAIRGQRTQATRPDRPAAPSSSAVTSTSFRSSYSDPNNGGAAILERAIQRATNSAFTAGVQTANQTSPRDWTGLTRATTYYTRYRVRNAEGWSDWSPTTTTTTNATVPDVVDDLATGTTTGSSIPLTWSHPASGGSAITGYDLQRSVNSNMSGATTIPLGVVTSYNSTGLSEDTTYYYRIRPKNAVGVGSWSAIKSGRTKTRPSAPRNPSLSGIAPKSMTLSWTTPLLNGGYAISGYQVQYGVNSNMSGAELVDVAMALSFRADDLNPGTTYYWRVRARNSLGYGDWSGIVSAKTKSGMYVGVGGSFVGCEILVGVGGTFQTAEIYHGQGDAFVPAG